MTLEMFVSALRPAGDLAGVFDYADDTGYFYLYNQERKQILGHIHIVSGTPDFSEADVEVHWASGERMVGILIRGHLWAVFRDDGERIGGNYRPRTHPEIPELVSKSFQEPRRGMSPRT